MGEKGGAEYMERKRENRACGREGAVGSCQVKYSSL